MDGFLPVAKSGVRVGRQHPSQIVDCFQRIRVQTQCLSIMENGLFGFVLLCEYQSQMVMSFGVSRVERQRLQEPTLSFVELVLLQKGDAEIEVSRRTIRGQPQNFHE